MRLHPKELHAIKTAFEESLKFSFKLYLFGSRTNDLKKGGDIDLLVIVQPDTRETAINLKSKIRKEIFNYIPEQKIDITVATEEELKTDPFLSSVFQESIHLCSKN